MNNKKDRNRSEHKVNRIYRLSAKQRHRINLLKYLGDWENDFPNRTDYLDILGIKRTTLYKHFTPTELLEIENEGLEIRKKNSGRQRAEVYSSLFDEAKGGNISAIKEFFDRTEGKVKDTLDLNVVEALSDEEAADNTRAAACCEKEELLLLLTEKQRRVNQRIYNKSITMKAD
jgi:hypothetical protein